MAVNGDIVSRHFLRRRARESAHRLDHAEPAESLWAFRVERASRGPFRWVVRRVRFDGIAVPKIEVGRDGRSHVQRFPFDA